MRHCGFEAVGRITIIGGSCMRDHYTGWMCDPREKSRSSPLILSPSLLAPLWWVTWMRKTWRSIWCPLPLWVLSQYAIAFGEVGPLGSPMCLFPPPGIVIVRIHPWVYFTIALAFDYENDSGKCLQGIFMSWSSSG